jgi:hypothetical protein
MSAFMRCSLFAAALIAAHVEGQTAIRPVGPRAPLSPAQSENQNNRKARRRDAALARRSA